MSRALDATRHDMTLCGMQPVNEGELVAAVSLVGRHEVCVPQWPSRLERRTYKQYWLSNAKVESSILSWGIFFSFILNLVPVAFIIYLL